MMIGQLPFCVCAIIFVSVDRRLVYGRRQNSDIPPGPGASYIARFYANSPVVKLTYLLLVMDRFGKPTVERWIDPIGLRQRPLTPLFDLLAPRGSVA
jgi:hypothetical protein